MPYTTLDGITRFLTPNVIIHSAPFTRCIGPINLNFGSRMSIIKLPNNSLVLWSAIPYGKEAENMINEIGKPEDVKYLIIPDLEHTMAAAEYQRKFPDLKIIGMNGVKDVKLANEVTDDLGNKLLNAAELQKLGFDKDIYENFEMVFLPTHANKELVVYDLNSKILFEGDLLFNLQSKSEHFSEKSGYKAGYNPNTGGSFMTRYMNPESKIGRGLFSKLVNSSKAAKGLQYINQWDKEKIVMCHGEVIEADSNSIFKKAFNL